MVSDSSSLFCNLKCSVIEIEYRIKTCLSLEMHYWVQVCATVELQRMRSDEMDSKL